jgi:transcriptional regulator with XRE-family HTH domain
MASLRTLRESRHLTQEQLAAAAEVSSSTVHNTETGRTRPRPAILRRLARALGVDPGEIEFAALSLPEEHAP